jgi:hypothetical protein
MMPGTNLIGGYAQRMSPKAKGAADSVHRMWLFGTRNKPFSAPWTKELSGSDGHGFN